MFITCLIIDTREASFVEVVDPGTRKPFGFTVVVCARAFNGPVEDQGRSAVVIQVSRQVLSSKTMFILLQLKAALADRDYCSVKVAVGVYTSVVASNWRSLLVKQDVACEGWISSFSRMLCYS